MLFHVGRQGLAALPERLSKDERRFSRRGPDFRRDRLRKPDQRALSPGLRGRHPAESSGYPYRCADEADIQWAGRDLGGAVVRSLAKSVTREELARRETFYPLRVASAVVKLPGKEEDRDAELMAMKIGPYLLLTMPGEPMVEYGFKLEKAIADRAIPIVLGYSNGNLGYIATADAHTVGGYEPNRSPSPPRPRPSSSPNWENWPTRSSATSSRAFRSIPRT